MKHPLRALKLDPALTFLNQCSNIVVCDCLNDEPASIKKIKKKKKKKKNLKRTLFIETKHDTRIIGIIPFIKLQNNTTVKKDEKCDGDLIQPLICFWLSEVVFVSSASYSI